MNRTVLRAAGVLALAGSLLSCSESADSGASRAVETGLVARWPAEAGPRSHPATLTGGVSLVSNKVGKGFQFDGSNGGVAVPDAPELNFRIGEDFSIAAWIQAQPEETSFGIMPIVDKRKVNSIIGALGYALCLEYGKLAFQLAPAAPARLKFTDVISPGKIWAWWQQRKLPPTMAFARFSAPGPELRDGAFHHVAVTVERRSKSGGKLYVDGKVVLTFDPTGQAASLANREPLLIGTHPDPALHCPYKGTIADVRLYSRALRPGDVMALCQPPEGDLPAIFPAQGR